VITQIANLQIVFGFWQVLATASSPSVSNEQFKLTRCATEKYVQCLAALFAHIFRPHNGQLNA
jgi:hypothetical protein